MIEIKCMVIACVSTYYKLGKAQKERVMVVEMMKASHEILRKLGIKIQESPLLPDIISTV